MTVPVLAKILLGCAPLLLAAAYWLHGRNRRNLAAASLLAGLAALVAPLLVLLEPPKAVEKPQYEPPSHYQVELHNQMQMRQFVDGLVAADMAKGSKRLSRHEATVYSQYGEDGIIVEIFRRIGGTNRRFVEFGSGDGRENNTALLLMGGWSGLWMDAREQFVAKAKQDYRSLVEKGRLDVRAAFVNGENVEGLFQAAGVPQSFDLLSIDIDRNDYWVWKAIRSYRPRVVVIEYNAIFPPAVSWVVNYEPQAYDDGTSHFGASLTALEELGAEKGYALVGCNLLGSNAFFVRREEVQDRFAAPYTAANHYQPPRYFLVWYKGGHARRVGPPGQLEFR